MRSPSTIMNYGLEDRKVITTDALATATQLKPHERNVTVISTLGVATVYLPPVSECAGNIYSIVEILGTADITIKPFEYNSVPDGTILSATAVASIVLTAALDHVVLFSTGTYWIALKDIST